MRILIVDDHELNRRVMARLLGALGHDVVTHAHGAQACAAPDLSSYDLLLLDLHMPGMSGLDTAAALRAAHGPQTPLIFVVTADVTDETRRACANAGIEAVYSKPVTIDVIGAILANAQAIRAPAAAP